MSPRRSDSVARAAPLFAALGDPTRLRLVDRLSRRGRQSITQLAEEERVSRQAVTKHLEVLQQAGLVLDFREGRERIFELRRRRLDEARRTLDVISRKWDEALERLRRHVEE